jgi:hypothetical protein
MLLLSPGFSFLLGPHSLTGMLLPKQNAPLPDILSDPWGIGGRLKPHPFSMPQTSAGELLRTP